MKLGNTLILALSASVATGFFASRKGGPPPGSPEFMDEPAERIAWNDCGGKGASASMKIRTLAAKLNGASALPREWVRNAGQDCMETDPEDGNHVPFPGHNGFATPAVVHAQTCALHGKDSAACQGDDNCELNGEECIYNQEKHKYSHEFVFPKLQGLYSEVELALGAAEEITRAGIVELNAHGKHAGMEKLRAKQHYEDFHDEEAAMVGAHDVHEKTLDK